MHRFTAILLVALVAVLLAGPAGAKKPPVIAGACDTSIARLERHHNVPVRLLHAVALAESGRAVAGGRELFAWPWTVTARGKGRYYPDKKSAIAAVRKLRASGVRNIDVGCMQVNLKYHPRAFENLEQAFDPVTNTGYAARHLADLRKSSRTWTRAVGRYHTGNKTRGAAYSARVFKIWRRQQGRDFARRRMALIEAHRARRAAWAKARTVALFPRRLDTEAQGIH